MVVGHVTNDGQAQTGSAGATAPGAVYPIETLEHPLEVLGRDAHARIDHLQHYLPHPRAAAHDDHRMRIRILHRILQKVIHRRNELAAIAEDIDVGF